MKNCCLLNWNGNNDYSKRLLWMKTSLLPRDVRMVAWETYNIGFSTTSLVPLQSLGWSKFHYILGAQTFSLSLHGDNPGEMTNSIV